MAICRSCNNYYKHNQWNSSPDCEDCADTLLPAFDDEDSLEVEHLLNPSGKTIPKFYE